MEHPTEADEWQRAIREELANHKNNGTFKLVQECGAPKLSLKWVFARKKDETGRTVRYKARLCARGFTQQKGRDYSETFAPVMTLPVFRVICALATHYGYPLYQVDITAAYLHATVEEDLYVHAPGGMNVPDGMAVKLEKALYGLKQSGRRWAKRLSAWLVDHGFTRVPSASSVYVNSHTGVHVGIVIGVYVDDICGTAPSAEQWAKFVNLLGDEFPVKHSELKMYLGIVCERHNGSTLLHQKPYIQQLLETFNMDACRVNKTPAERARLTCTSEEDEEEVDVRAYKKAVGMLQWLSHCTRPDITLAVNEVSKFSKRPASRHWTAVKRIMRYLAGTRELGIGYQQGSGKQLALRAYVDSDYAGDPDTRRSTYGYLVFLAGGPVAWRSKQQQHVARSTAEAEYCAIAESGLDIVHLRMVLMQMRVLPQDYTVIVENDNKSALAMAGDTGPCHNTRHVDVKYHWIREAVENGVIKVVYSQSNELCADALTKPLGATQFIHLRDKFMMKTG